MPFPLPARAFALGVSLVSASAPAAAQTAADEILVTAARAPVARDLSGVSATVFDRATLEALALPTIADALRLSPSAAVATAGGPGQQTQVRLRGAEANHTLVFIDGIEVGDPGSGGEFRFETLATAGVERVEVLRGPQSALWGSEAIGGVVSVTTLVPPDGRRALVTAEGGSLGTWRAGGQLGAGGAGGGVALGVSHLETRGIDVSGTPGGDRDGHFNTTLHFKGVATPAPAAELGLVARYTDSRTRFDGFGFDGRPADQPLASRNRALALRGYGEVRAAGDALTGRIEAQYLDTANRNASGAAFANTTDGGRFKLGAQGGGRLTTGALTHRLVLAGEWEEERFERRDADAASAANQRRRRDQVSGIAEYRVELAEHAAASVSVRHDDNSGFADATVWRAAGAARLGGGFGLHASYGEGVTNPSFFEQFGFFPGSFIGNPALVPERARGFDAGVGWARGATRVDVTYHRTRLEREIVSTFDFSTFLSGVANAAGRCRRQGIEVSAEARPLPWLSLAANYAWLDATQPKADTPGAQAREVRRPRHSGALSATVTSGRATVGLSAAYVGERAESDFATFPATVARLGDYVLASVAARYRLWGPVELTARVENAFDQRYEDVLGYRTPRFTAYGGVRVALD